MGRPFVFDLHHRAFRHGDSCRPHKSKSRRFLFGQLIDVVRPLLHHHATFTKELSSVVRPPKGVSYGMCELVLDEFRTKSEFFADERSCDSPEAMSAKLIVSDMETPHRGEHGVIRHRLRVRSGAGEDKITVTRYGTQLS
jgi:hypothetical protein